MKLKIIALLNIFLIQKKVIVYKKKQIIYTQQTKKAPNGAFYLLYKSTKLQFVCYFKTKLLIITL